MAMASCVKNVCIKNYYNLSILKVTIDSVGDVFDVGLLLFILTHISLVQFSPDNAVADSECGEKLTNHLMPTCVKLFVQQKPLKLDNPSLTDSR